MDCTLQHVAILSSSIMAAPTITDILDIFVSFIETSDRPQSAKPDGRCPPCSIYYS